MPINVDLNVIMAKRHISAGELAEKAIRFSTLEALCKTLDCQPGDILSYEPE